MISPSHLASTQTALMLVLLLLSGCFHSHGARMDPTLPIDTTNGYAQSGRTLDPESMVQQLSREDAPARHIKRARTLAVLSRLFAGAGGALLGWPLGQYAGGAAHPNWSLAYVGVGLVGAAIPMGVFGAMSMRKAIDTHNAGVSAAAETPMPMPVRQVVQRDSLLFTESDLSGMTLTWLGVLGTPEPKLALRFQRSSSGKEEEVCRKLDISIDGQRLQPSSSYKAVSQGSSVSVAIQAEFDLATLDSIVKSRQTTFTVCGRSRRLTAQGAAAGARFLRSYEAIARQRAPAVSLADTPDAPAVHEAAPNETSPEPVQAQAE